MWGSWSLYPSVPAVPAAPVAGMRNGTQPCRSPGPLKSHGETPRLSRCQAAGRISGGLSPVPSAGAHRCSCLGSLVAPGRGSHVPILGKPRARGLRPERGRGAGDQQRDRRAHTETRAARRARARLGQSHTCPVPPGSGGPQDARHTPGVSLQVLGGRQPPPNPPSLPPPAIPGCSLVHMAQQAAAGTVPLRLIAVMVGPSVAAWPYSSYQ